MRIPLLLRLVHQVYRVDAVRVIPAQQRRFITVLCTPLMLRSYKGEVHTFWRVGERLAIRLEGGRRVTPVAGSSPVLSAMIFIQKCFTKTFLAKVLTKCFTV